MGYTTENYYALMHDVLLLVTTEYGEYEASILVSTVFTYKLYIVLSNFLFVRAGNVETKTIFIYLLRRWVFETKWYL